MVAGSNRSGRACQTTPEQESTAAIAHSFPRLSPKGHYGTPSVQRALVQCPVLLPWRRALTPTSTRPRRPRRGFFMPLQDLWAPRKIRAFGLRGAMFGREALFE